MRVGLLSDTHGHFDGSLIRLFLKCDLILHAGDIMGWEIISQLQAIAPVVAVRGNNDCGEYGRGLEELQVVLLEDPTALLVHDLGHPICPRTPISGAIQRAGAKIVIHGHTHQAAVDFLDGILYVNPGSAGRARYNLPRSAGLLTVNQNSVSVEIFNLEKKGLPPLWKPFVISALC